MMTFTYRATSINARLARNRCGGQSMTEFLLIGSFAAMTLFAMPALTEYATTRLQTVSAARFLAWQRTVWLPEVISAEDGLGARGAIRKTDEELSRDFNRHIFRDRKAPTISIHGKESSEFEVSDFRRELKTDIKLSTTIVTPPSVTNAIGAVIDGVNSIATSASKNSITSSFGQFQFISGGYFKNQIEVTHKVTDFKLFPQSKMAEHVTMLTEPWNAGGTIREEQKIQGLVPMKFLDFPIYQQFRSGLHQLGYSLKTVFPSLDINNLLFGLTPGDAFERSPVDRFEVTRNRDAPGTDNVNKFRWYRSFPPAPVVNTLP